MLGVLGGAILPDQLGRWTVGQVRLVTLSSVKDGQTGLTTRMEEVPDRGDGGLDSFERATLNLAEAIGEQEVPLHINDK